jgi:hypothetical protein
MMEIGHSLSARVMSVDEGEDRVMLVDEGKDTLIPDTRYQIYPDTRYEIPRYQIPDTLSFTFSLSHTRYQIYPDT